MIAKDTRENILAGLRSADEYVDSGYVLLSERDDVLVELARQQIPYPVEFDVFDDAGLGQGLACTTKRTECLRRMTERGLCWALLLDSDDVFLDGGTLPDLTAAVDWYFIAAAIEGTTTLMPRLLRLGKFAWTWEGNVHESLMEPPGAVARKWPALAYRCTPRKREPSEYLEHASWLRDRLAANPSDTRAAYYLARSLHAAGKYEDAIAAYGRRVEMGGWAEEVFWSLLAQGDLAQQIDRDAAVYYEAAHRLLPDRAEPLVRLSHHLRLLTARTIAMAEHFAELAARCPYPSRAILRVDLRSYSAQALEDAGIPSPDQRV